jgi:hypothetical protein
MIEWRYEGYREVWLYDATGGSTDGFHKFCREVADAISDAETVDDLATTVERVAGLRNLVAQVHRGPSHSDPMRNTVRVGVFTDPPTEWLPPER